MYHVSFVEQNKTNYNSVIFPETAPKPSPISYQSNLDRSPNRQPIHQVGLINSEYINTAAAAATDTRP